MNFSVLEVRVIEVAERGDGTGWHIIGGAREVFSLSRSRIFSTKRELVLKAMIRICSAHLVHTYPPEILSKMTKID